MMKVIDFGNGIIPVHRIQLVKRYDKDDKYYLETYVSENMFAQTVFSTVKARDDSYYAVLSSMKNTRK